jgi:hypothetical protein
MNKKAVLAGILGVALVCGLLLTGCGGINEDIVGKWALEAAESIVIYEFTKDGEIKVGGFHTLDFKTTSKGEITTYFSVSKIRAGTCGYSIASDKLTLKGGGGLTAGTYVKAKE